MRDDLEEVRRALGEAVARTHLERPGDVAAARLDACVEPRGPYWNAFTTNYYPLICRAAMQGTESLQVQDGFRLRPRICVPRTSCFTSTLGETAASSSFAERCIRT